MKTPAFQISIAGQDVTGGISERLVALTITETRGEEADQLDLTMSDHDGRLALPNRGAMVSVSLGWKGSALVDKGKFKIDEIEHSGPPDVVTVRARAADLTDGMRVRRDKSWRDTTLGAVIKDLASASGLEASVAPELNSRAVAHLAQSNESDVNLLTRLGRQYDAAATIKSGRLIFSPVGRGSTPSGRALPSLEVNRNEGDRHSFKISDRESYKAVEATYHDVAKGKRGTVEAAVAGQGGKEKKRLRRVYASEAEAKTAVESEARKVARMQADMSLTLAYGLPQIYPEQRVKVRGFKPEIEAAAWLVKTATHTLAPNGEGFTTSLELETG